MKLFDTRLLAIFSTTVVAGVVSGHLSGLSRLRQVPATIRSLSAEAGDSFLDSPMYFVGFSYALYLVFVATLVPVFVTMFRTKSNAANTTMWQFMLNSTFSTIFFFVIGYLVFRASAH